jgi:hypothetical protein
MDRLCVRTFSSTLAVGSFSANIRRARWTHAGAVQADARIIIRLCWPQWLVQLVNFAPEALILRCSSP